MTHGVTMEDPKNTEPLLANQSEKNEVNRSSSNGIPHIAVNGNTVDGPVHQKGRSATITGLHPDPGVTSGGELVDFKQTLARQFSRSAPSSEPGDGPENGRTRAYPMSRSLINLSTRQIKIEEFAPSNSSFKDGGGEKDWRMSLHLFSSKKRGKPEGDRNMSRRMRRYYKRQDELISTFEDMNLEVDDAIERAEGESQLQKTARLLAKVSFGVNLLLLASKAVAAALSGSLAIVSAVIDSAVDLVSGALMWWSNRAMKKRDIYQYPQGRTKLEPIAIVILSVIMSLASFQVILESIQKIISFYQDDAAGPVMDLPTILICVATVVIKLVLFLVCYRVKKPSVQALAQDHRNDVLSNFMALACGYIGAKYWKYADPIGAVFISIYIIVSWCITGYEQIKLLTGHTAQPDFLKKITWIALNHHEEILLIDTVRGFHFGNGFLVEVDVVLPEDMSLRESHDIGESLQLKIERLTEVERAFVHLDYECEHHPHSEHKLL